MQRRKSAGQASWGLRKRARSTLDREFDEIAARVAPTVLRVAYLLTGRWSAAERVVEAAYTEAFQAKQRICRAESPDRLLRDMMLRSCIDASRQSALGPGPGDLAIENETTQPDQVEKKRVRAALAQLPRFQREVLVLRFYADVSESGTAAILGRAVEDVSVETARAMVSFAELLAEQHSTDEYPSREQE